MNLTTVFHVPICPELISGQAELLFPLFRAPPWLSHISNTSFLRVLVFSSMAPAPIPQQMLKRILTLAPLPFHSFFCSLISGLVLYKGSRDWKVKRK